MIVKGIVLIILVFAAFTFLGLKISESVNSSPIRLFFFCLYFMSIFTIFNVCLTIYFFIKLKGKKGRPGRKGLQGKPGDIGISGNCGSGEELRLNHIKALHMKILNLIDSGKITTFNYKTTNYKITDSYTITDLKKKVCEYIDDLKSDFDYTKENSIKDIDVLSTITTQNIITTGKQITIS